MNRSMGLARGYAAVIGVALVLLGVLGFIGNPIVGDGPAHPLFVTGTVHNLIHLISGALALYVAFGLTGEQRVVGVIGIGLTYLAIVFLTLVNADLFGLLGYPVSVADHLLHLVIGLSSLVVGWYERSSSGRRVTAP